MHPFRVQPEAIDRVICGTCGHPAWDHFGNETNAEADVQQSTGACRHFALTGFKVSPQVLLDNVRVSQLA